MAALVYIVYSLLFSCLLIGYCLAVDLFPYGVTAGDEELEPNDDGNEMVNSQFGFIFYNTTYNTYYVRMHVYVL